MHVVHILPGLHVGGAEMALLRMVGTPGAAQVAPGSNADAGLVVRHTVISMKPAGSMGRAFATAGIPVVSLDFSRHPVRSFVSLCRWMRVHRPDVVCTWMYYADLTGSLAARLCGLRSVVWGIRSTAVGGIAPHWVLRVICRFGALLSHRLPRAIVCVAEASRTSHVAFGYRADVMRVIPNGFDTELMNPQNFDSLSVRSIHGFGPEHIVVGQLGRYCAEKDQLGFLKAARLALDSNAALRFVLVGRDINAQNSVLMEAVRELRLEGHVRLLDERPDVAAVLMSFDIFALSSTIEGFPNVLGEAMAMALPCVTTDAGDARLLAGHVVAVVPPSDPQGLADQLLRLARLTPAARGALGQASRARIVSCYTIHDMRKQFEAVYRDAMGLTAANMPRLSQSGLQQAQLEGSPHVRHHRPPAS